MYLPRLLKTLSLTLLFTLTFSQIAKAAACYINPSPCDINAAARYINPSPCDINAAARYINPLPCHINASARQINTSKCNLVASNLHFLPLLSS